LARPASRPPAPDQGQLSVYAALRSDLNLTVMVINKTANNLSTTLALSNFNAGASAKAWLYAGVTERHPAQPNVAISGIRSPHLYLYSMTMLAIRPLLTRCPARRPGAGRTPLL